MGNWYDLAGQGIGAIGSVVGGIIQSNAQKKINEQNIAMQRETNAMQRAMFDDNLSWQRESQQIQNDYNSIGAQYQRAVEAGINPFGANSTQTPAGSPAGGSAIPSMIAPRAEMIDSSAANIIGNISQVAQAISALSSSRLNDAKTVEIRAMLEDNVRLLSAQVEATQEDVRGKHIANNIAQTFGVKQAQADLYLKIQQFGESVARCDLLAKQGKVADAETAYKDVLRLGEEVENDMKRTKRGFFSEYCRLQNQTLEEGIKTARTEQSRNAAATKEHEAGAFSKSEQAKLYSAQARIAGVQAWFEENRQQLFKDGTHRFQWRDRDGKLHSKPLTLNELFGIEFGNKLYDMKNKSQQYENLYQEWQNLEKQGIILDKQSKWVHVEKFVGLLSQLVGSGTDLLQFFRPRLSSSESNVHNETHSWSESHSTSDNHNWNDNFNGYIPPDDD